MFHRLAASQRKQRGEKLQKEKEGSRTNAPSRVCACVSSRTTTTTTATKILPTALHVLPRSSSRRTKEIRKARHRCGLGSGAGPASVVRAPCVGNSSNSWAAAAGHQLGSNLLSMLLSVTAAAAAAAAAARHAGRPHYSETGLASSALLQLGHVGFMDALAVKGQCVGRRVVGAAVLLDEELFHQEPPGAGKTQASKQATTKSQRECLVQEKAGSSTYDQYMPPLHTSRLLAQLQTRLPPPPPPPPQPPTECLAVP